MPPWQLHRHGGRLGSTTQIDAEVQRLREAGLIEGDRLSASGQARRDELEATTDAMEQPIVDALGSGFDALVAQVDEWSTRCIDARAFPPDAFKRAAG